MMPDTTPKKRLWLDPLLVVAIALLVFSPVLTTTFSPLDDYQMLARNPAYHPPTGQGLIRQLTQSQFNIYAPLTYATWYVIGMLTYANGELPALGYKIASWLAHAGSAAAAWWGLWLLVRHRAAAGVGAMIVAVHPMMVESVAWTTGLKDILCGGLGFLTIALYLRRVETGKRKWGRWALAASILAMAAKPTAMTLPAMLLAVDFCVREVPWKRRLRSIAPFVPAAVVCAIVIYAVQKSINITPAPIHLRPMIAMDALAFYIGKVLWPLQLAVDYARTPAAVRQSGALAWTWVVPVVALLALLATRKRLVVLAGVLFLVPLSPVLGLVTFDMQQYTTVADHYVYQSMLGVGLLVAIAVVRWRMVSVIAGVMLIGLGTLSVRRLMLWNHLDQLFADSLRHVPESRLARQLLTTLAIEGGDYLEGERLAREAIALGGDEIALDNLAHALERQGRLTEAAAATRKMLDYRSDRVPLYRIKRLFVLAQRIPDADLARHVAMHWAAMDPADPTPRQIIRDLGPVTRPNP